jgi:hypothetical protein
VKTAKLPCGCRYELGDRERWIELCPPHAAEADTIHDRWAQEHREHMARDTQQQESRK